jgi:molybdopterin molybdotransferase
MGAVNAMERSNRMHRSIRLSIACLIQYIREIMISTQRLPASLVPLDVARAALLHRLEPVVPTALPLAEALTCVASDMPASQPLPACDTAVSDGWALRARDLVGASPYSPLPLPAQPAWVEAGAPLPDHCDCVVDIGAVDQAGPLYQVLAEAIPGQGVRRAGCDTVAGSRAIEAGRQVRARDLLVARAAGLERLNVRRPRLRLVNIPATSGQTATARLICDNARAAGAEIFFAEAAARDSAAIASAIDGRECDMLATIGGSGLGRADAAVTALAARGEVLAHGIALLPGRTSAVGRIGKVPVLALPGDPAQALAAWWTLALPVLDQLSARLPRPRLTRKLARKIASSVGVAEIVLLEAEGETWIPLAIGDLSLAAIARADAWLTVAGGSEGFAAGTPVDAYLLQD